MKINKIRRFTALLLAGIFIASMSFQAQAKESIVISSIAVKFKDNFGDEQVLEPEITVTGTGYEISEIDWSKDVDAWKPGKRVRVSLTLTSDEKVFASTYTRTACKVTGAIFVSAKAHDNHTLELKADYIPVVNLGATEQAGWSSESKTKAVWKRVEYATGYQLNLYADNKKKKTLTVTGNSVDLAEYMNEEASYFYEVKAIGYTAEDRKYMKEGGFVLSSDTFLDETWGDVTGKWTSSGAYKQEDGAYANDCWKLIRGKWYYFNSSGQPAKGWLNMGERWYHMAEDGSMDTGWIQINNQWYYLNPAGGEMMTGWVETQPAVWYYLDKDGIMAADRWVDGYYLSLDGRWIPSK